MGNYRWAIILGLGVALVALIAVSIFYPTYGQLMAAVVTAIATAFIAVFTWTLWDSNRAQVKHLRGIERAYISGGGWLDKETGRTFCFTVNNYGKTPGVLLEYAVEFCSTNNIPATPIYDSPGYRRVTFNDRIAPGPATRVIAHIPVPNLPAPILIYGRYWFEDIWKDLHSSGFVLLIQGGGTTGHVPAHIPREYTNWY